MPNRVGQPGHVVVLMLENRSFDHMLGWPAVSGQEVPVEPGNPGAGLAPVFEWTTQDAYRTTPDPGHQFEDVTLQLYGQAEPPDTTRPTNNGFVISYSQQRDDGGHPVGPAVGKQILGCFAPELLPVLRILAENFVVCDRWFASVPGPTWPNRDYVHAGTSMGHVNSPTFSETLWGYARVRTIYQNLQEAGKTWKIYYHDVSQAFYFRDLSQYKDTNFAQFSEFDADVEQGLLPNYSFIEPRFFNTSVDGANDQHPPHDVREGERLIAAVYDSLRSRETVWQDTLLIVVYDEHGGFYDHVAPPLTVSPGDVPSMAPPFDFDRLGVRVPALLVSPWVPKGRVDSVVYDHTTILGFLKKHFGLPMFLHRRDAAAQTFEHNFLDHPRTDAPISLTAQVPLAGSRSTRKRMLAHHAGRPLSDYQRTLMVLAASLQHPRTQDQAARFVAAEVGARSPRKPQRAKRPVRSSRPAARTPKVTMPKRKRRR